MTEHTQTTIDAIAKLLELSENWDSYGAPPIDPNCVNSAIRSIKDLSSWISAKPSVAPTSQGGIQIEWHLLCIDMVLEVIPREWTKIQKELTDIQTTIDTIEKLLSLEYGWDSYGALPIDVKCAYTAMQLATRISGDDWPLPSVVPTVHGGVQLEWHLGIDIEVSSNKKVLKERT